MASRGGGLERCGGVHHIVTINGFVFGRTQEAIPGYILPVVIVVIGTVHVDLHGVA